MPQGHFAPRNFAPNHTKFWKGDILPKLQNYGGHFAPTFFCVYIGHILGIYWVYLGYISGISWAYLVQISGISWTILGISQAYLGSISGISWAYLGCFQSSSSKVGFTFCEDQSLNKNVTGDPKKLKSELRPLW